MTAKEYLSRISELENMIVRKKYRCRTFRDIATNTTVNNRGDAIQKSKDKSPLENIMVKVIDLEREIEQDEVLLVMLKVEVLEQIDMLRDERYQKILWMHYGEHKSWNKIASEMRVSRRHIIRLHNTALEKFEKIFKKI